MYTHVHVWACSLSYTSSSIVIKTYTSAMSEQSAHSVAPFSSVSYSAVLSNDYCEISDEAPHDNGPHVLPISHTSTKRVGHDHRNSNGAPLVEVGTCRNESQDTQVCQAL